MVLELAKVDNEIDKQLYPETRYHGSEAHNVFKQLMPDGMRQRLPLEPSLKLRNHSPDGFSWGYGGSGPAQLALALLLDATTIPETALDYYQEFKAELVAGWPGSGTWVIFRSEVIRWVRIKHAERIRVDEN